MGRRPDARSRSSTSTSRAMLPSTSRAWPRPAPTPASTPGSGTPGVERPPRAAGRRTLRRDRRRSRRDVDRVPPQHARLGGRRRARRAQPAHLGLDVPLGRAGRAAARLGVADAHDDVLGRALPGARRGLRLGRVRRHPACVERGAHGGAAPPGGLGEDVRPAARADLGRRGARALPAHVDGGGARRRLAPDRRLPRPVPAHLRARRARPRGRCRDPHEHARDRHRVRGGARHSACAPNAATSRPTPW